MVKAVRVSGTDRYGKEWDCGIADWYSAVGEDQCFTFFGVNCLQLQVFDCLNCEV